MFVLHLYQVLSTVSGTQETLNAYLLEGREGKEGRTEGGREGRRRE